MLNIYLVMNTNFKKGIIYTCITGDYDMLMEHSFIDPMWDYVCFTDSRYLQKKINKNSIWNTKPLVFNELDDVRNARWHKLHAHDLFLEYQKSIWVDANVNIISQGFFSDVEKVIKNKQKISIPIHPDRKCIYEEYETCVQLGKDRLETMKDQVNIIKKDKFPRNYGLFETNIIYREHHDEGIIRLMLEWWWWIENYSRRDQLSLTYVLWKNGYKINPLDNESYRNKKKVDFIYNDSLHITKEELIVRIQKLQKILEQKNHEILQKDKEIENKNKEIVLFQKSRWWKLYDYFRKYK